MDRKLLEALIDCASVMERDLSGLALIQPELKQAKIVLAEEVRESAPWTGEGLPPVGTVCEYYADESNWRRCEVVAHRGEMAIVWVNANHIFSSHGGVLRAIRTPEQIAAEEREEEIKLMVGLIKQWRFSLEVSPENPKQESLVAAEALYAAGYRKQVTE